MLYGLSVTGLRARIRRMIFDEPAQLFLLFSNIMMVMRKKRLLHNDGVRHLS